ncbi:MAG: hypothetical protein RL020_67 [Pseudomonadota bacterium]|jgi:hypothetical protein
MSHSIKKPKTVYIIGAGASDEVNLPVGDKLKSHIANVLDFRAIKGVSTQNGDEVIRDAFRIMAAQQTPPTADYNPLLRTSRRIRDAMPQTISIDNFIDAHSEDKEVEICAKLAIVRTILEAEAKSTLFIDKSKEQRQLKYSHIEKTWYNSFWKLLSENCKLTDLEERLDSVVFIIFNYDRCIEHFLFHSVQNYYSISEAEAAQLLLRLEIYHPYGTVGKLPWQIPNQTVDSVDAAIGYGDTPNGAQLISLAKQIKTFSEGSNNVTSDVDNIRLNVMSANRLVFLGFAFHKLNLDLLLLNEPTTEAPPIRAVFSTGYGLAPSDKQLISSELATRGDISGSTIYLQNEHKCFELFKAYWRSLAFN